jgi:hypothetical protein
VRVTLYGRSASNGELALFGTAGGLESLCVFLRAAASGEVLTLRLAPSEESDGYDADLEAIDLAASGGPTRVSVSGTRLIVSGSPDNIRLLARNIDGLVSSRAVREGPDGRRFGPHHHVQPDLAGTYVATDSSELVVCRLLDS